MDRYHDEYPSKNFSQTLSAILRLLLIVILLGAWISAATGFNFDTHNLSNKYYYSSTYTAFLIITVVAFVVSLLIFLLSLFGYRVISSFLFLDIIFMLAVIGVSIAMAIAASDYEQVSTIYDTSNTYRRGSFAAAAAFGLVSFFFYFGLIIVNSRKLNYEGRYN